MPLNTWKAQREQVDLCAVVTSLLGPAERRQSGRAWWLCPFHPDRSPSFSVTPGRHHWRCWVCNETGDAADLVMRLKGVDFVEAKRMLADRLLLPIAPSGKPSSTPRERTAAPPKMKPDLAAAIVAQCESRLWGPGGERALAYLQGPRGLTEGTIRAARLGLSLNPRGITIPWFRGQTSSCAKRPAGCRSI
jgi:DNA primase